MNLLTRILGIDVPAGTTFNSWEPSFRGLTLGWLIALVLVILIGMVGVVFFYCLEKGTVGWVRRIVLIGLRCGLLLVLLFLLLRPMLLIEFVGERKQGVALLIDNSESMKLADRRMNEADKARVAIALGKLDLTTDLNQKIPSFTAGPKDPPRMDLVKGVLKHEKLDLLEDLRKFGPLRPYLFGAEAYGLEDLSNDIATIGKIDPDRYQITLRVKGKDLDFIMAEQTLVLGGQGKTLKERLQEFKTGAAVHYVARPKDDKVFLAGITLADGKNGGAAGLAIAIGFTATQTRTALADGIVKILQSKDADPPSAIVVITDGQDNASKYTLLEAAEECRRMKIPLHIYGVGSSEGGQLQLKEVGGASSTLFAEDHVTIPLRWRAQGFTEGKVEVVLTLNGKEVGKKEYKLQTGEDLRDEIGFVVPKDSDKKETQDLVATIKVHSDGQTFKDTMTRTMRVVDSKIKILYIEHSPRWEFKFLQPALSNRFKKRCDVDFMLVNAAKEVAEGGPPYLPRFFETREKFLDAKYNLIILGDVLSDMGPPDPKRDPKKWYGLNKDQQEWIREFVQNRGGLIVIGGRQNMPGSYDENAPLAEVLPVKYKQEKFGILEEKATQEYKPTLTDAGQRTDWLAMADTPEESTEVWTKKLPGFHWNYPLLDLRPAATALIVNPSVKMIDPAGKKAEQPMPVLATHLYGKGRVVWMGTDETWRWRWNYQDKYFDRFWGQLIYQLGSPSLLGDGAERTQIALDRSQALVGTKSTIHVTLLDKDFNPRKDPKVEAELEYVDAKPGEDRKLPNVTLNLLTGNRGEYTALIPHQRAGRFELRVKNPETNTFSFRVDLPPKHELEESGLAEKPLRDAALLSGGRFYREEDLYKLTGNIEVKKKEFTRRQEVLLWNPLAILLFVGLITMEWLVRKFSDLS